jgi:hypothetical protein
MFWPQYACPLPFSFGMRAFAKLWNILFFHTRTPPYLSFVGIFTIIVVPLAINED